MKKLYVWAFMSTSLTLLLFSDLYYRIKLVLIDCLCSEMVVNVFWSIFYQVTGNNVIVVNQNRCKTYKICVL